MAYGLNKALFLEDGPAIHAARAQAARSQHAHRAWQRLGGEDRLQLIDQALRTPANDIIDEFPLAL